MTEVVLVTGGTGLLGNGIRQAVNELSESMKDNLEKCKWEYLSSKDCDLQ